MAEAIRDTELEARMLRAVIADRNAQPRNQQIHVGPSSIGFCRELLRAQLFEAQDQNVAQETSWATAAHVGSVMGDAIEEILSQRMGALTQQRVTTTFPLLGVSISGAIDVAMVEEDEIIDLKSTTDMGGTIYDANKNAELIETLLTLWREGELYQKHIETPDGSYELTDVILSKFSKLQYYVQLAIYVAGCVQNGILADTAEARIVYYDRAGDYQEFVAIVITNEELNMFFDIGQHRVRQAAEAQELFERTGNPMSIHHLRDQVPSFCFSKKVQCPLRERCWGGSQWDPNSLLDSPELSSAVDRYIEGRRLSSLGDGMKKGARSELSGITGKFSDGRMVTWSGNRINVVEGKPVERPQVMTAPQVVEPEPPADSPGESVGPTPPEQILEANRADMTPAQIAYLERKAEEMQAEVPEVPEAPEAEKPGSTTRLRRMQKAAEARVKP